MVNCRISRDVKERAIALFRDMDLKSITHVLDVSTHLISRWIFNVSIYGDVGPPKSPLKGRPRVCKSSTLDRLTKFLLKNPTVYLDEVQFWLSVEEGILISISTIHRYQKYVLGFTNKCVTGSAIERNNKERVHWYDEAQGMLYDFQILCTDQSYIDDCTGTRQKGYAIRGEECFVPSPFCQGDRYTINPVLSVDGFIALEIIEGSMDGAKFYDFILLQVVSHVLYNRWDLTDPEQLPQMNPWPQKNSVLLLDNCAIHHAANLERFFDEAGMFENLRRRINLILV